MKFLHNLFFFNCPLCKRPVFRFGPVLIRYQWRGNETPTQIRVCHHCFQYYGGFR